VKLRLKLPKLPRPGKKGLIIAGLAVLLLGGIAGGLFMFGPREGSIHFAMRMVGLARPIPAEDLMTVDEKRAHKDEADFALEASNPEAVAKSDIVHRVRQLQQEMTMLASGDPDGSGQFKKSMIEFRDMLRRYEPQKLDPAEVDALVIYLLSGGTPELVTNATSQTDLSTRRKELLEAAVAYVSDKPKIAIEKLNVLDPEAFPGPIAARLNMMNAQLRDDAPYQQRRQYLVQTATLASGTLVEEAATRRLVNLAATKLQRLDFVYWSNRYERRFPRSLYFTDFTTDLVKGIAALEKNKTPVADLDLELLEQGLPDTRKVPVMGDLQAVALRAGHKRLCNFAFGKIVRLAAEDSEDMSRARLYESACNVDEGNSTLDELADFKASSFSMEDVEVLRAATSLADGIARQISTPTPTVYGPQQPYDDYEAVKKLNASVAQQLGSTTDALKGISP